MLEYLATATGDHAAHTEVAAGAAEHHVEPTAFGIAPGGYIALAMLVVFAIMLKARVPALVAKALDARIASIRTQLDEAARLRAEAETLRDEYAKKASGADAEIAALMASAEHQASEIVEKAKRDSTALIARRKAMAQTKIAAAERAAVDKVRAVAASAAAAAAGQLIAQQHGAEADRKLADQIIAGI